MAGCAVIIAEYFGAQKRNVAREAMERIGRAFEHLDDATARSSCWCASSA